MVENTSIVNKVLKIMSERKVEVFTKDKCNAHTKRI